MCAKNTLKQDQETVAEKKSQFTIASSEEKQRLDHYLARKHPELTRSYINKLILNHHIIVGGRPVKAGYKIRSGDVIDLTFPEPARPDFIPEKVEFETLFEDKHLVVISKPPGIVVHPAAGNHSGTLVHGLLYKYKELPQLEGGRPGIVHRLDKDTSGIMLVAKTETVLRQLSLDFQKRQIRKIYQAVLSRSPQRNEGRIVAPIGRHPVNRKKMAIRENSGKYAATQWKILERFDRGPCLAEIHIETGRTHQIRVHMASLHTPVAGDELYGGKGGGKDAFCPARQMLHAWTLSFQHPVEKTQLCFTAPLWPDITEYLNELRRAV